MHYSLTSCQLYFLVPLSSFLAHLLALSNWLWSWSWFSTTHTHKHTHTPGRHTTKKSGLVRPPHQLLKGMVLLPQVIVNLLRELQILLLLWWQLKVSWLFLQLPVAEHILSSLVQNICSYICATRYFAAVSFIQVWVGRKAKTVGQDRMGRAGSEIHVKDSGRCRLG